jgi:predicted N-acyltransferase
MDAPAEIFAPAIEHENLLEPPHLVSAFVAHPPRGFRPCAIRSSRLDALGFVTDFDLTTTLDGRLRRAVHAAPLPRRLRNVLRPKVVFGGTTVTEYFPFPRDADPRAIVAAAVERMRTEDAPFVILKDIPRDSPLLSRRENELAARLRDACRRGGFVIVSGQALAYVPIDFESEDAYLFALSRARRKDLRRKLRSRASLDVQEIETGDPTFDDEAFIGRLIRLYENVYAQSLIHFDELTPGFVKALFRSPGGTVFLYRQKGELIGYNLCFVHRDCLVDKYVGFAYPEARDANLYFVSWFHNLEWARRHGLKAYVAGWTDPEVKRALGARFTFTDHAVYARNSALRFLLRRARRWFEADANVLGMADV